MKKLLLSLMIMSTLLVAADSGAEWRERFRRPLFKNTRQTFSDIRNKGFSSAWRERKLRKAEARAEARRIQAEKANRQAAEAERERAFIQRKQENRIKRRSCIQTCEQQFPI